MAWNLIAAFEYYLLATFGLSLLQVGVQGYLYRTILSAPHRWPNLVRILRENVGLLITLPTGAAAATAALLWVAHLLLRRVAFADADLPVSDLATRPVWFIALLALGVQMVVQDAWALVRALRRPGFKHLWAVDVTEASLRTVPRGPVRGLVEALVRFRLLRKLPLIHRWLWLRAAEQFVRFAFGALVWGAWLTAR